MSFADLSDINILYIAASLTERADINALARVCRRNYDVLNSYLYQYDAFFHNSKAFLWAILYRQYKTAVYALDAGADPNMIVCNDAGVREWGPGLYDLIASDWESPDVDPCRRREHPVPGNEISLTRLLFERGAELDLPTATHVIKGVLFDKDTSMLKMLLERGVHKEFQDRQFSVTMMQHHVTVDDDKLRILLSHGFPVDTRDGQGATQLYFALKYSNFDKARLLLHQGADPNTQTETGVTPVHMFLSNNNSTLTDDEEHRLLLMLVKHKANINMAARDSRTPVTLFVEERTRVNPLITLTRLFLDYDADIYGHTASGSLLHSAARYNRADLIPELLDLRLDINSRDQEGCTPLIRAADSQPRLSRDVINLLLDAGTDLKAPDLLGRTAASFEVVRTELSKKTRDAEMAELLEIWSPSPKGSDHEVIYIDDDDDNNDEPSKKAPQEGDHEVIYIDDDDDDNDEPSKNAPCREAGSSRVLRLRN